MNLFDFFEKKVRIVDIDGKEWKGYVLTYTPKIDTEDELCDEIGLRSDCDNLLYGFRENDIKTIEEVKDDG